MLRASVPGWCQPCLGALLRVVEAAVGLRPLSAGRSSDFGAKNSLRERSHLVLKRTVPVDVCAGWRTHSGNGHTALAVGLQSAELEAVEETDSSGVEFQAKDVGIASRAYHLGSRIDFSKFWAEQSDHIMDTVIKKDQAIFKLRAVPDQTDVEDLSSVELWYLVLHSFGVATFVGTSVQNEIAWIHCLQKYTEGINPEAMTRSEEIKLNLDEELPSWFMKQQDAYQLQRLDIGNIRVISLVLAQSVALNHYTRKVDQALDSTSKVLQELAVAGRPPSSSRQLISLIAESQLLYTDVIRKLGVIDVNDSAWHSDRHHDLWQNLRTEYELDTRLEALERKMQPIIENAKFILEVDQGRKTMLSEKWIIMLIGMEIALNGFHYWHS